jgi:hypothetical protein
MGKRSSKRTVTYDAVMNWMFAGAHSGREGRAARDVIYDIYARAVIYAAPYPTNSRTARSAWSIATCA